MYDLGITSSFEVCKNVDIKSVEGVSGENGRGEVTNNMVLDAFCPNCICLQGFINIVIFLSKIFA